MPECGSPFFLACNHYLHAYNVLPPATYEETVGGRPKIQIAFAIWREASYQNTIRAEKTPALAKCLLVCGRTQYCLSYPYFFVLYSSCRAILQLEKLALVNIVLGTRRVDESLHTLQVLTSNLRCCSEITQCAKRRCGNVAFGHKSVQDWAMIWLQFK